MKYRILNIFILTISFFLLSGFSIKNYPDKAMSCKYTSNTGETLTINVNDYLVNITLINNNQTYKADITNINDNVFVLGNDKYMFLNIEKDDFFQKMYSKDAATCPPALYVINDGDNKIIYSSDSSKNGVGGGELTIFNTGNSEVIDSDGSKKMCHHENSTVCKNITWNTFINDERKVYAYLEFGYYTNSENKETPYFGVSSDENYNTITFASVDAVTCNRMQITSTLKSVDANYSHATFEEKVTFIITNDATLNELLPGNKAINLNSIKFTPKSTDSNNYVIAISGPKNQDAQVDQKYCGYNGNNNSNASSIDITDPEEFSNCNELLGQLNDKKSPIYYLNFAFQMMKYIGVVMLIVMTVIDFIGAVTASDDDKIKKASGKAIKRLIACIALFLLPIILRLILELAGNGSDICELGMIIIKNMIIK